MTVGLFTAAYPGRCDADGCVIEPGDRIGFTDGYDHPLCAVCWRADREETGADMEDET
jgi:hypothetical protein